MMSTLYLNTPYTTSSAFLCSKCSTSQKFSLYTTFSINFRRTNNTKTRLKCSKIRAIGTIPETNQANEMTTNVEEEGENETPYVGFAFVSSVLLPDGTPDMQMRSATGGQKLRDIMLDNDIDLYGPYARPLLNCGGGGTCGSCMVEVIEGKELLSLKTDKEKELLKRKPKNWRLACQTTVGKEDSTGVVVIQQLPEWKAHEWKREKDMPNVSE